MQNEVLEQYNKSLKEGQKYMKAAQAAGTDPYLPVLDEQLQEAEASPVELGLLEIPMSRIVGTKTAGRVSAMAGNFMPILPPDSEFGGKWMHLCEAHLSDIGIREPIRCFEYLGKFYVQEGNKRVSVLRSYGAPRIPAYVTRMVPRYSEDEKIRSYFAFLWFYERAGLYEVELRRPEDYGKLQAALGFEESHQWTEAERRSFLAGFTTFSKVCQQLSGPEDHVLPAQALLIWTQVYSFADIKALSTAELQKKLKAIWPDVLADAEPGAITLQTQPDEKEKSIFAKLLSVALPDHLNVAFIYADSPAQSPWAEAHDLGRAYLEERFPTPLSVQPYTAPGGDFDSAIESAIEDGADLVFATTAPMIGACRRAAAAHPSVKILNCALSLPYTGVRMYYSRMHESKFVTGALAGAMTDNDLVGYVANYPIYGTMASINAFALGVRLTNPRARVKLVWSCMPGDPVAALLKQGITVISNREASAPGQTLRGFELGTYKLQEDGSLLPLALPVWHWGGMYEKIVQCVLSGAWSQLAKSKAVNYWWGLGSGALDVQLGDHLPDGVCSLGWILKNGVTDGSIAPFRTRIVDQNGLERNNGWQDLTPEEMLTMDWLCDNVDGVVSAFDELLPQSKEIVRLLGIYRDNLPPEKEEKQL